MRSALPPTFICGVVRNAAGCLKQTLGAIKALEAVCESSSVLIVTNDNTDETDAVLRDWRVSSGNYEVLWLEGLAKALPERLDRITTARNLCLLQLRGRHESKYPLLMMMDLDGPNSQLRAEAVLESLSNVRFQWDGIFANQRKAYYDIYALRHDRWCPNDCWDDVRRATTFPFRSRKARAAIEKFVHSRQFKIPPEHPPIEVRSAFGGLGVYRTSSISGAWYACRDERAQLCCEHVLFNQLLREKSSKLFIVPDLLNDAPTEHLGLLSGAEFRLDIS